LIYNLGKIKGKKHDLGPPKCCTILVGLRDVGILQIFYSRAVLQRTIVGYLAFLEPGLAERLQSCPYNAPAEEVGGLDGLLYEAAQRASKSFQIFKIKI
jgi:hypothetical protein